MTTWRYGAAVLGVLVVVGYAVGSALWVQTNSGWYASLQRPSWQPPDVVFGLIWPYNFIVLGIASVVVAQRLSNRQVWVFLLVFAVSVVTALAWSYLFYVSHALGAATVALLLTALLTIPLVVLAFRASVPVGVLMLPYQVWVAIATSLSWGYWRLM